MIKSITYSLIIFVIAASASLYGQSLPASQEVLYACSEEKPALPANLHLTASCSGIDQTKEAAALFFKLYEAYLEASADGEVNFTDVHYLLGPAMLLIPAFSGAAQILNELEALTDDKINILCSIADEYNLGTHTIKAKQAFKTILILTQTYYVFNKG